MIDVVMFDDTNAWSPSLNARGRSGKGVGGFEVFQVQIATWLASKGYKVVAYRPSLIEGEEMGVDYRDSREVPAAFRTECRALITARHAQIPEWVKAQRTVTSAVDDPRFCDEKYDHLIGRSTICCLSEWQAGLYRTMGHECTVIPSMLDDYIYEMKRHPLASGWVCVNAWNKGTEETLKLWVELKSSHPDIGELSVGTPYGAPDDALDQCRRAGARWLGQLTPVQIVRALAGAEAVFRVCKQPETFGVTDAIAEVLGLDVHMLVKGEMGASRDVLCSPWVTSNPVTFAAGVAGMVERPPRINTLDYRVSTIMPRWLTLLGLE